MAYFVVTPTLGGWQVRPDTVASPPIATFSEEADARMFAAAKEAQRRQRIAAGHGRTFKSVAFDTRESAIAAAAALGHSVA